MNNKLGQLFLNDRIITKEQLDEALEYHKKNSCLIGEALLDQGPHFWVVLDHQQPHRLCLHGWL